MSRTILLLPGLNNSGEGHWQTLWEKLVPNAHRVQQHDWDTPQRADWVAALDAEIEAIDGTVTLVTHSLGCVLTAWWAAEHGAAAHASKVTGALLVAPPDVERADFPLDQHGFAPMPRAALPFKSIVVASSDDPWCALPKHVRGRAAGVPPSMRSEHAAISIPPVIWAIGSRAGRGSQN